MRKRLLSRCLEPIDEFLDMEDLSRKQVPRDGSSLFRAIAEMKCFTQRYHNKIRELCLDYILMHKTSFQELTSESIEKHVAKMRNPSEWPGRLEAVALAYLFQLDIWVYCQDCLPPTNYTNCDFDQKISLFKDNSNHFDIIYSREHTSIAGFCQALVYQLLYENVFEQTDVMNTVDQMLHENTSRYRNDSINSCEDISRILEQINDCCKSQSSVSVDFSDSPIQDVTPPFPYRVAKALDPDIYRNSDLDIFTAMRKEARYGPYDSKGLQIGVKVVARMWLFSAEHIKEYSTDEKEMIEKMILNETVLHGHIQSMKGGFGPVEIYAEEIGKRIFVPYESLEKCVSSSPLKQKDVQQPVGSPPSYHMVSTSVAKKPSLPFPEYVRSPVENNRKKSTISSLLPSAWKEEKKKVIKDKGDESLSPPSVARDLPEEAQEVCGLLPSGGATADIGLPAPLMVYPQNNYDYHGWYIMNPLNYPVDSVTENVNRNFESSLTFDMYSVMAEPPDSGFPLPMCSPQCQQMGCFGQYGTNYPYAQPPEVYCAAATTENYYQATYGMYPMMYGASPQASSVMMPQMPVYYDYYDNSQQPGVSASTVGSQVIQTSVRECS